jgi:hypothetical protein
MTEPKATATWISIVWAVMRGASRCDSMFWNTAMKPTAHSPVAGECSRPMAAGTTPAM